MIRVCSVFFTLICSGVSFSQDRDSVSVYQPIYGFNIGLNQSALHNSNATNELQIKNALGFRLGVFAEFPISKRWSITPKSELSFNYGKVTENDIQYRVDPYNLDFMLHFKHRFKLSSEKVQPYFNIGPNLRTPLKKSQFDGLMYDTKVSLAMDFGFGVEFDLKHFYLSPEIRFSGGLTDIRSNPSGKMLRGSNAVFMLNFSSK